MKFCPRCSSLLVPKEGVLRCSCGYSEKNNLALKVSDKPPAVKEIEIIDESQENIGDAVNEDVTCYRCQNKGAYTWFVQMRRSDEGVTRFFKCRKCKAVWRTNK